MEILVGQECVCTLNETQKKVIMNDIHEDEFDADMKRRLKWVLMHLFEKCFEDFKKEWEQKLKENGVKAIPLDDEEFANLVFSQPNYKNRSERDNL